MTLIPGKLYRIKAIHKSITESIIDLELRGKYYYIPTADVVMLVSTEQRKITRTHTFYPPPPKSWDKITFYKVLHKNKFTFVPSYHEFILATWPNGNKI
jgi:hypothetical protein